MYSAKSSPHHKKRGFSLWLNPKRKFLLVSAKVIALFFLFFSVPFAYAEAPTLQRKIIRFVQTTIPALQLKPKPLTQSKDVLPAQIQDAIEALARQEIQQEQAIATLSFTELSETRNEGFLQPIVENIGEIITRNPADRAKLRIRKINRLILSLQRLLTQNKSDTAIDKAAGIIARIGTEIDKIAGDPNVQTDREVLTLQIEQYNRLQLIIQQLEDNLPLDGFLTLEDARQAHLVPTAVKSINSAPNLDAIHTIALPVVARFVGDEFAELKAIEIITDFEDDVTPVARQKIAGLAKELATSFEKKMLKLPRDVRNRELQSYINYSFGDPLLQVAAFEHLEGFLTDRELILSVQGLKELAIIKLEQRVFEPTTKELRDRFLDSMLQTPQDLRVLSLLQMHVNSGASEARKQNFLAQQKAAYPKVIALFGKDPNAIKNLAGSDILDVSLVTQIAQILEASPDVPPEVKTVAKQVGADTLQAFLKNVSQKSFISTAKAAYNPVSESADVRLLPPNPQVMLLLEALRAQVKPADRSTIDKALRAQATVLSEHLLHEVNQPELYEGYQHTITTTPAIRQRLQSTLGKNFFTALNKKGQVMAGLRQKETQALYEKIQQMTQRIFLSSDNKIAELEHQLPDDVIASIQQLKKTLPGRAIPRLTVPKGVTLPKFAKLPTEVEQAIIQAAKARIAHNRQPEAVKLDLQLHASDLGIGQPRILPGSFLYPFKKLWRNVQLVVTFDPLARAQRFLQQSNEKTLEAAILLQKDQSQKTIGQVLGILDEVRSNFEILKKKSTSITERKKQQPEKIDRLINTIITNGLARQTLFSAVEDHVYGADFVKVERIRQQILADGVSTLLTLSGNDAQIVVDRVEAALDKQSGSQFKELKAIELITEIKRTQPKAVGAILEASEIKLAKKFETKLLALSKEARNTLLLAYAGSFRGNPVRQFEAYEQLKDNFTNPETLLLVERLKDKAVKNLRSLIAEIGDASTLQEFVDATVGDKPEDLKIITEIQLRVETHVAETGGQLTPIEAKIEDIKAQVEENILATYQDDPVGLAQTDFFNNLSHEGNTSVVDVIVAQELEAIVERSPEVSPEVVETVQNLEGQVVTDFIEAVTNIKDTTTLTIEEIQALEPSPLIIETLVELKEEAPPAVDALIDNAIEAQVGLIEEQVTTIDDSTTLETYLAQIEENPVVAEIIADVGGTEFTQVIEQVTTEVTQTATQEQTLLEETVAAVQEEIFAAPVNDPAPVTETLSEPIQEVITQIQTEEAVPTTQIPETTVTAPAPAPVQESAPAPVQEAPSAPAPVEQSAPAPEAPAAPVGL